MDIEFYNVKKRKKVQINESDCTKVKYEKETKKGKQVRYAFRAEDDDGTNLTLFCSEDKWKKSKAKEG